MNVLAYYEKFIKGVRMVHKKLTLPNILSLFRIVIVPFLIFTLVKGGNYLVYSLILFVIASVSDFYDGFIARRYNKESKWGAFLDPLADKVLILSSFSVFYFLGIIKFWVLVVVFGRDLAVTCLRIFSQRFTSLPLKTSKLAKIKTFLQCILIFFILVFLLLKELSFQINFELLKVFEIFIYVLLYFVVALTFYSGLQYFIVNRFIFKNVKLSDYIFFLSELISTCFFMGYISFAPGTLASLVSAIIWFIVPYNFYLYFLSIIGLFFIGVITSGIVADRRIDSDPSYVVIDEFVGMALAVFLFPKSILYYGLAFLAFRFFDIVKIFPINLVERIKGGFGIMLDDIVAAIFTMISIKIFL